MLNAGTSYVNWFGEGSGEKFKRHLVEATVSGDWVERSNFTLSGFEPQNWRDWRGRSALGAAVVVFGEGNGNPLQCSCLENPRDGGAWWAAVYGVAQSRTRLKRLSSSSSCVLQNKIGRAGYIQWKATVFQILWQSSLQILTKTHCGPAEDKWLAQGHRVSQWHSYDLKQHCLITNWFSQPSRCAPSSVYGSKMCRVNSSRAQTESWPALHSSHHQAHALSAVNTWLIDFV